MYSYSKEALNYAKTQGQRARSVEQTEESIAQANADRIEASTAAKAIRDRFPEVHSILVSAYKIWGVWELDIFDLFDKDGVSIHDQEDIRRFILEVVVVRFDTIRSFEIYSGEITTLQDLIED